jgi:hypothetical protein
MKKEGRKQAAVEFFSFNYRLSGIYSEPKQSLGDAIYENSTAYLMIDDVYISPVDRPTEISANYNSAIIVKKGLSLMLAPDKDMALRRDQKYGSYLGIKLTPVFLALPFFEVRGDLRLPGRFAPRVLLSSQTENFMTLMNVTAHPASDPTITYEGEAGIVNKSKISFMGLDSRQ